MFLSWAIGQKGERKVEKDYMSKNRTYSHKTQRKIFPRVLILESSKFNI